MKESPADEAGSNARLQQSPAQAAGCGARPQESFPERTGNRAPLKLAAVGAIPSRLGIRFNTSLQFEDWQALGVRLGSHVNSSMWWLGDWLEFGREMYGPTYKLGVALTGLEYKTLRNYAYVARRFRLSRRRDSLSFQHHAEVAPLAPQDQDWWLDRAEKGGWTRAGLRSQLRTELPRGPRPYIIIALQVEPTHRWCDAAARCGCELQTWIEAALDGAAETILSGNGGCVCSWDRSYVRR